MSGGTAPYTYLWSDVYHQTTPTASGLPAGMYQVSFYDSIGNQCSTSYTILEGIKINSFQVQNQTCIGGSDGSIYSILSGIPPYTFNWIPTVTTASYYTPTYYANNLSVGNYSLCITDSICCQVCTTAVVLPGIPFYATTNVTNASCPTCCDGSVSTNIYGGSGPYTWSWSDGEYSQAINNLCQGIYNCCITDVEGCTTCDTTTISFPTSINNYEQSDFISVFPNPTTSTIIIQFELQQVQHTILQIKNILGQIIYSQQLINTIGKQSVSIDLSEFSTGLYFIKFQTDAQTITKKIVKQ
jgi:hypothetical protein